LPLLDHVQECHAATGVALGQRDDKTKVGLQQMAFRALTVADNPAQVPAQLRGKLFGDVLRPAHPLSGVKPGFDARGDLHLLLGIEQGNLADLLEIRVPGRPRR
jgi:hypothetical protein